ncbi:MAG: sarcosine oxidase subunit beta, partial [Planctomycetota bacterium]
MTDVAIIGAGVIGCAIAWELKKLGARATVIDREGDAGHGSTSASCGIVRRFYSTRTMIGMAQEGAETWAHWGEHTGLGEGSGLARFERPGMLFIPPALDAGVDEIVRNMRSLGVAVEVLSPDEVKGRFAFLDTSSHSPVRQPKDDDFFEDTGRSIAGAVFEPDAGYVISPMLATQNLRAAGERDGVEFLLGRAVVAIRDGVEGQRFSLELADGTTLGADVVVNAAGPHSALVNRMAGVSLPIETRALRREVCALENPVYSAESEQPLPVVGDLDSGIYFRPETGARDLIVGSLDPRCDVLEWVDNPDEHDPTCSADGFERQVLRLMKRFPEAQLGKRRGLSGMYDVTPLDWNPVLDRTEKPGYYVAIGTSGSSFKTAPVIGSIMAQLIDACEAGRDHDADPLVVLLPRSGFELNVGFFSRLRGAHVSSGT